MTSIYSKLSNIFTSNYDVLHYGWILLVFMGKCKISKSYRTFDNQRFGIWINLLIHL